MGSQKRMGQYRRQARKDAELAQIEKGMELYYQYRNKLVERDAELREARVQDYQAIFGIDLNEAEKTMAPEELDALDARLATDGKSQWRAVYLSQLVESETKQDDDEEAST